MEKIKTILNEMGILSEQQKFRYGCVMLYFGFPDMDKVHNLIDPNDLYEEDGEDYGFETEPHVTLLFGLHKGVPTSTVEKVLDDRTFYTCKGHNASIFENEKYDVLKFDIEGDGLHEINDELKKQPHTSDFPDYHPHMTIAYLKPGKGKKYIKMLKGMKYQLPPKYAVYSKPNGTKNKITIKVD